MVGYRGGRIACVGTLSFWLVFLLIVQVFHISYVSEMLYVHSKVMIVDDRRVIVNYLFLMRPDLPNNRHLIIDGIGEPQRA